jgi:translocator protein
MPIEMPTRELLVALAVCAASALLEGVLAGPGIRRRLAELRQPRGSPKFGVWVGIGLMYYVTCLILLSRLIGNLGSPLRRLAVALVIVLLLANAAWNFVFFRRKDVQGAVVVSLSYGVVALVLAVVLFEVDRVGAWVFLPYVLYLVYATWWILELRRLNRTAAQREDS